MARFGPEQFVLLTPAHRPAELVERAERIAAAVSATAERIRSAHAAYPGDGETVDGLLSALDERIAIGMESGFKLLAFRATAAERNRRRSEAAGGA